jgi:hypothetical protein
MGSSIWTAYTIVVKRGISRILGGEFKTLLKKDDLAYSERRNKKWAMAPTRQKNDLWGRKNGTRCPFSMDNFWVVWNRVEIIFF